MDVIIDRRPFCEQRDSAAIAKFTNVRMIICKRVLS
jgi:hypothetical protein